MKITVLKEVKIDETRVALRPDQAEILCGSGHQVFVETGAGLESGFSDDNYIAAGAEVCEKQRAITLGKLILKVKAPMREEYQDYSPEKILFTYLHLDENIGVEDIKNFISSGVMGVAYEWVGGGGDYPLLTPMSRLTGYLFAHKAMEMCAKQKGIFVPRNEGFMPGGRVLIIGSGNIGLSAIKYFIDLGASLTVLCKDRRESLNFKMNCRYKTAGIDYIGDYGIRLIEMNMAQPESTRRQLANMIVSMDILINCAIRRPDLPKQRLPYLITKEMVQRMQAGSVICDATACNGDLIETCFSSPLLDRAEVFAGVTHYNCDHIPSLVPKTATALLTDVTFQFIRDIADKGVNRALAEDARLLNGVSCYRGHITHLYTSEKKGLPYCAIHNLLDGVYV